MNTLKKIFNTISQHFLLRNVILAVCLIIVLIYIVNLMLNIFTRHNEKFIVPDFSGHKVEQVGHLTKEADLELIVIDSLYVIGAEPGSILDQSPKAGSGVKSGRKIFLTINSMSPRSEVIPYVTGYSLRQAKNMLETKGFEIEKLVYKSDMATNNVIGQSFNGKEITRGSTLKATLGEGITLTVGVARGNNEAPLPLVPRIVGLSLREAKSRLWEIGLNVGEIIYDTKLSPSELSSAKVYKQVPDQQNRTDYGSKVTMYMSIDNDKIEKGVVRSDENRRKILDNPVDVVSEEELEAMFSE